MSYPCDLCGESHPDRGAALLCCGRRFDGVSGSYLPADTVGEPRTDGGQLAIHDKIAALAADDAVKIIYDPPQGGQQSLQGVVAAAGEDGGVRLIPPGTSFIDIDEPDRDDRTIRVWGHAGGIVESHWTTDSGREKSTRLGDLVAIRQLFADGGTKDDEWYPIGLVPEQTGPGVVWHAWLIETDLAGDLRRRRITIDDIPKFQPEKQVDPEPFGGDRFER